MIKQKHSFIISTNVASPAGMNLEFMLRMKPVIHRLFCYILPGKPVIGAGWKWKTDTCRQVTTN
jgi:hypothetical protein